MKTLSFIELMVLSALLIGAGSEKRVSAQEADALRELRVEDYFALKDVNDPRISPDGAWVAYTVTVQDLEADRSVTRLWMVPTSGGDAIPMTAPAAPSRGRGGAPTAGTWHSCRNASGSRAPG